MAKYRTKVTRNGKTFYIWLNIKPSKRIKVKYQGA